MLPAKENRMTPQQSEHAHAQILAIATTAAQLSAGLAQILKQQGQLPPAVAQHFAKYAKHLGELFQSYGDDELAADFGAQAAILASP